MALRRLFHVGAACSDPQKTSAMALDILPFYLLVLLTERTVYVPPLKSASFPLTLPSAKGLLTTRFEVQSNKSGVRVLVFSPEEYERLAKGQANRSLSATDYARDGELSTHIRNQKVVRLVFDNRMEGRSTAEIKVRAEFVEQSGAQLTPEPWRANALVSGAFFLMGLGVVVVALLLRGT